MLGELLCSNPEGEMATRATALCPRFGTAQSTEKPCCAVLLVRTTTVGRILQGSQ